MANQYIRTGAGDEKYYYKDIGETILHREDGPAYEASSSSYQEWWLNNKIHRIDGPAVEHAIGNNRWFVNGIFMFETDRNGNITRRMY